MLPQTRRSELHVEQVGEELVICDQRTQAAHCLNPGAAFVWHHCDGRRTPEQIADTARCAGLNLDESAVEAAIALLRDKELLETSPTTTPEATRLSRRVLTKAAAAALIPAIVSIAAPSAVLAQSGPIRGGGNGGPIDGPISF